MGLDAVELVMAIEDEFGIHIEDAEAEGCVTPRILIGLVWSKVSRSDQDFCPTQRAFYITRAALVSTFGVDRKMVKRSTPIADLIPSEDQATSWALLRKAMDAGNWPDLVRPRWMFWLLVVITISAMCVPVMIVSHSGGDWGIWLAFPVGIIVVKVAGHLTLPWKKQIPIYGATIEQLAELAHSSHRMEWTRAGVAEVCKRVIMDHLSVPEDDYSQDAHFVKDYGC